MTVKNKLLMIGECLVIGIVIPLVTIYKIIRIILGKEELSVDLWLRGE